MPYIIRPRGVRKIAVALFGTALLIGAVPALANAACPKLPVSQALAQFGDNSEYALVSGSSFESGARGWSLTNAEVVSGSGANGGSDSLVVQPNGLAVSPGFCVSSEYPSFRFFARQISGGGFAALNVSLRWTNVFGFPVETPVASLQPNSEWTLSPVLRLAGALPLWMPGSTLKVRLVFQPIWGGSWAIDDVYIDPYSR
jgi:hypothetical protein